MMMIYYILTVSETLHDCLTVLAVYQFKKGHSDYSVGVVASLFLQRTVNVQDLHVQAVLGDEDILLVHHNLPLHDVTNLSDEDCTCRG